MPLPRWELLIYALAILGVLVWTSRPRERMVDLGKMNALTKKVLESPIPKTDADHNALKELTLKTLARSDEADPYYTALKKKFDPSPLGENGPNPDFKPYLRDLRKRIRKVEEKLEKADAKGEVAASLAEDL